MEFHPSKCQVISITNKVKPIIGNHQTHNHIPEQVHCAKYLGIYVDSKLTFSTHVDAIVKKANSTRAFLARNIPQCCRKVRQMVYATYIRPIVEYALPAWDPHSKRDTNRIEMVRHMCILHAAGNCDHIGSVTFLLKYPNWPTLQGRKHQNRLAVMYRILHNPVDIRWQSFLTRT